MYGDTDFYTEPSEFEQEIGSFKESLRKAVKEEITTEITELRAKVKEQGEKLKHLDALELEALRKSNEYDRMMARAERDAEEKVRKEGIRKLLEVLADPRYQIGVEYRKPPKCDKCDADRRIPYTSPLGREMWEHCDCASSEPVYVVEEQMVQEVSKHSGELVVWYQATSARHNLDRVSGPTILKNPEGVPFDKLMKSAREYGFKSKEEALQVASALNKERAARPKEGAKSDGTW